MDRGAKVNAALAGKAALFAAKRRALGIVSPPPKPLPVLAPRLALRAARPTLKPSLDPSRQLELVAPHRRGSKLASRDLVVGYEPMISGYAALFAKHGSDADEAAQCGRIALMKAADRHDPARGAFAGYAWQYIYFAMLRSARETALDGANSADVPMFDDDVPMVERLPSMWGNPESILIAKEEYFS